jgi:transcriptional regulator with XRE-family HTH domain
MSKQTMATQLPRRVAKNLSIVGEQIRLARLRRNHTMAQIAERAQCSLVTLGKVEKGDATVSIGIYLRVLYALRLDEDILFIARDDELGRHVQDYQLLTRKRATKTPKSEF